jgi:hypothetical protein
MKPEPSNCGGLEKHPWPLREEPYVRPRVFRGVCIWSQCFCLIRRLQCLTNKTESVLCRKVIQKCHLLGALVVVFFLLFISARMEAQSTFGSVRGIAQDSSGASLPDAQITLHSIDDRTVRPMPPVAILLRMTCRKVQHHAQHDGFAEVAARQDERFTLALTIATQASTVEVTSSANQINTENGVIGDSKGTGVICQLPLNFRASTTSPLAALSTSPNVQQDSQGNIANRRCNVKPDWLLCRRYRRPTSSTMLRRQSLSITRRNR